MPHFPFRWDILEVNGKSNFKFWVDNRIAAIRYLGGSCKYCEYSDKRALVIDHINGDGCLERKQLQNHELCRIIALAFYLDIKKAIDIIIARYQVLCANCNMIKASENHENDSQNIFLQADNMNCLNEVKELKRIMSPYRHFQPRKPRL